MNIDKFREFMMAGNVIGPHELELNMYEAQCSFIEGFSALFKTTLIYSAGYLLYLLFTM